MVAAWLSKPSARLLLVALVVAGIVAPLPGAVALIMVRAATLGLGGGFFLRVRAEGRTG
jgi:hypothetical protein